jgi:hypothetical protein
MSRKTAQVYRDVTITRETRDALEDLLSHLEDEYRLGSWQVAVREVVQKWDANDATEVDL